MWDYLRLNVTSSVFRYSDQDRKEVKKEVSLCWPELDTGKKKNGRETMLDPLMVKVKKKKIPRWTREKLWLERVCVAWIEKSAFW